MNVELLQGFFTNVDEAVRRPRLDDDDVTRCCFADVVSDDHAGASLLHQDDFVVFVHVQRSATPRLRFDEKDGDGNIVVVRSDKVV